MAYDALGTAIRHLFSRIIATQAGSTPDANLLDRFIARNEDGAFEALVRRHGPMVFAVCRRILRDEHDAEDAFQAAFLVFARKAASIRKTDSLASWLYGVAYHTATRARDARHRSRKALRAARVTLPLTMSTNETVSEVERRELQNLLDDELHRLPEKYRVPIILCYLEGKTKDEAAQQLGWPEGTVSGRLARAKEMLRGRLARRGLSLSAGAFTTALTQEIAQAALPVPLIASTVKTGMLVAAGKLAAAGVVSAQVLWLTKGALNAMVLTKLKIAAAIVAVGVVGTTACVFTYGMVATGHGNQTSAAARSPATEPAAPKQGEMDDKQKLQGNWKLVRGEENGKVVQDPETLPPWVFQGEKLRLFTKRLGETVSAVVAIYELDQSKQPKTISLGIAAEVGKLGIYVLDGDDLTLCFSGDDKVRPTEFKVKPDSGQTLWVLKRESARQHGKPKADKPIGANAWHRTLANGVTVELLGVSENPSRGKKWWKPDGTLTEPPYDAVNSPATVGKDALARKFAIIFANAPNSLTRRAEFVPPGDNAGSFVKKNGRELPDMYAYFVGFPKGQTACVVRVGLAAGDWRVLSSSPPSGGAASGIKGKGRSAIFGRSREEKGTVGITITHNIRDLDVRVVAVDTNGKLQAARGHGYVSVGDLCQIDADFDLATKQIKEFQLQTRPFEWAEFKDVALNPRPTP